MKQSMICASPVSGLKFMDDLFEYPVQGWSVSSAVRTLEINFRMFISACYDEAFLNPRTGDYESGEDFQYRATCSYMEGRIMGMIELLYDMDIIDKYEARNLERAVNRASWYWVRHNRDAV